MSTLSRQIIYKLLITRKFDWLKSYDKKYYVDLHKTPTDIHILPLLDDNPP